MQMFSGKIRRCDPESQWLQVQVSHGLSGPFLRRAGLGKGFLEAAWSGEAHCGMVQWGPVCAVSMTGTHTFIWGRE